MNVTLGHPGAISGLTNTLEQPEFCTAIGLAKYGSLKNRRRTARPLFSAGGLKQAFGRFLHRS
jgi:cell division ATPase FtsA